MVASGSPWHDNLTKPPGRRNNPPDRRWDHTYPYARALARGRIQNIRVPNDRGEEQPHRFHFLTNPLEITTSYNVNMDIDMTNPGTHSAEMMSIPPYSDGLLSVSFNVLLDRTYEVWDNSLPEGVLHDIAQLERVLGLPDFLKTLSPAGDDMNPQTGATMTGPSSYMVANRFPGIIVKRPVRISFGGRRAFSFDGYVDGLSITMMKFSQWMVPTRAGLQISAKSWGNRSSGMSDGGGESTGGLPDRFFNSPPPGHPAGFPE